jgi:hypothetical protein
MTAQQQIYKSWGSPPLETQLELANSYCATCGAEIEYGLHKQHLNGYSWGRQVHYLNGSEFVCKACAYLHGQPKDAHRNLIAIGDDLLFPMIGVDSATDDRPSWLQVWERLKTTDENLPISAIITVDPKPKLWTMIQQVNLAQFGCYIHQPDYNVSEFRLFSFEESCEILEFILPLLQRKFSKAVIATSLLKDFKTVQKEPDFIMAAESRLKVYRKSPAFLPALTIAGISKC